MKVIVFALLALELFKARKLKGRSRALFCALLAGAAACAAVWAGR